MIEKKNIRLLSKPELLEWIVSIGEKKFRAAQIYDWLWKTPVQSFDEMTNLSIELRKELTDNFSFPSLRIENMQESKDGTQKFLFKTYDGQFIEGVLIPTDKRRTACISSQIGCNVGCKFCATGLMKQKRNLNFDEIFDQVVLINKQCEFDKGRKISNVVFMGMGEPLLNYGAVLKAAEKISAPDSFAMSPNRVTVSTSGLAKQITKLGDDKVKFKLALSLHAPTDEKRSKLMPINQTNNIKSLTEALNYYYKQTKNPLTFEYVLLDKVNDTLDDAKGLFKLYKQIPTALINIIEFNPVDKIPYTKSSDSTTEAFVDYLVKNRVNVRVRKSRGKDIDAACGQLAIRK